jgi:predicted acyltransferase
MRDERRRGRGRTPLTTAEPATLLGDLPPAPAAPHAGRLVALDAFRGITIAAMILVNNPGAEHHGYRWLLHAHWNGWRAADLIFPAFLVIAGVAIPLSFARQVALGVPRRAIAAKVLTRTRIIFGLGLLLNALPYFDWSVLRIPGVLQRIALCYGAAALLALYADVRGQLTAALALLLGYWALLTLVPVPGVGRGVLQPGTDLGSYLDRLLMGGHLYHQEWDPEGLLSTLPAIATTMAGVLAGDWLRAARTARRGLLGLLGAGLALIALGEIWNRWLPINKNLWTSSFAVFTAGTALTGFAICLWLIDVRGHRRWAMPFVVYGTNPILAYGLSSVGDKALMLAHIRGPSGAPVSLELYLFDRLFAPFGTTATASVLYAVTYTLLWLGVMTVLYRRGIFVKI